jgi:glycosyltransferase involved in cell wall biosynthesis
MRVALVTPYLVTTGGISAYVNELGGALRHRGFDVTYVADDGRPASASRLRLAVGVIHDLTRTKPDIVHAHGHWYTLAACAAYTTPRGIPLVFTEHTWPLSDARRQRAALGSLMPFVDAVVGVSRTSIARFKEVTRGADRPRLITIYPGVERSAAGDLTRDIDLVGAMVLAHAEKRQAARDFVDIVGAIAAERPETRAVLVGGNGRNPRALHDLRAYISSCELQQVIETPGLTPVQPYLRRAKALLHPSYRDNLPQIVLEAFSIKLPAIAYDVGAIAEIGVGRDIAIIEPGNVIAATAAVRKSLDGLPLANGLRALVPDAALDWSVSAARHAAVYQDIRAKRR